MSHNRIHTFNKYITNPLLSQMAGNSQGDREGHPDHSG
jgi:hypothetical protein